MYLNFLVKLCNFNFIVKDY